VKYNSNFPVEIAGDVYSASIVAHLRIVKL